MDAHRKLDEVNQMSSSKTISYLIVIGGVVGIATCFLYVFGVVPKEVGGIGLLLGGICSIEFNRNRKRSQTQLQCDSD